MSRGPGRLGEGGPWDGTGTGTGAWAGSGADRLGPVFAALADPTRRRVLRLLAEHGPGTPTQLASALPVSRQAVSKHLGALADAGLVDAERAGRETRYRVTPGPMAGAMSWMAEVGGRWDRRLEALREDLDRDRP